MAALVCAWQILLRPIIYLKLQFSLYFTATVHCSGHCAPINYTCDRLLRFPRKWDALVGTNAAHYWPTTCPPVAVPMGQTMFILKVNPARRFFRIASPVLKGSTNCTGNMSLSSVGGMPISIIYLFRLNGSPALINQLAFSSQHLHFYLWPSNTFAPKCTKPVLFQMQVQYDTCQCCNANPAYASNGVRNTI